MKDLIRDSFKGITPNYVDHSNVIVLNQKCIRNNQIDFSLARFHDSKKTYPSKKELQVGDILINSTGAGTAGRCAFIRELPKNYSVVADSHILVVRISDFFIAGCVQYGLFNIEKLLQTFLDGSTGQGEFDKQRLLNVIIPIPNNPKYIYQFLSNLDKKIVLNKQINARLEEMAKTLYDYWFVQFDFPDANGKPYKSSGGEMVFDETLKRKIPKGWEVKSLGTHITIKRGISYKSNEIKDTGIPFINLNSFYLDGKFKFEGTKFFTGKIKNDDFISSGDLLIAVTDVTRNADIIGKAFILPDLFNNSPVMSCDVAKISSSELNNFYLERLFNSSSYHEYIKYFASGTLVLHLDIKGISWFDAYIPPKILLDKFEDFCRDIHLRIVETEKQNYRLTQLRDFLLPMLMNGQVSVAE